MPNISDVRLSELLLPIYRVCLRDGSWQDVLAALNRTFSANSSTLILRPGDKLESMLLYSSGLEPPLMDQESNAYSQHFYRLDPFVNLPSGEVVTLSEFVTQKSLVNSEFYQQLLLPSDTHYVMGVDLPMPNGSLASLRLVRGYKAEDFSAADKKLLAALSPHLAQSVEIFTQLEEERTHKSLFAGATNRFSVASIILGDKRLILEANSEADQLLQNSSDILRREGKLYLDSAAADRKLQEITNSMLTGDPKLALAQAMSISRTGYEAPLCMVVKPVRSNSAYSGKARTIIYISDPEREMASSPKHLSELFGLTPTESKLALALANGASLEEASVGMKISKNTGRAHLRAIFSKTSVNQQSQLVSLILRSVAGLS